MLSILGHVIPVFAVIGLGVLIKNRGLATEAFFRSSERLVYYIFFPALLFWKISEPKSIEVLPWPMIAAGCGVIIISWAASLAAGRFLGVTGGRLGSFSQCSYRFNTYIGMAIVITSLGERGAALFGLLISLAIPVINVLAVSTFIWQSGSGISWGKRAGLMAKSLLANPLILACLAGLAYKNWAPPLPFALAQTLKLLANMSLPLALVAIGGSLAWDKMAQNFKTACAAASLKLVMMPLVGWGLLSLAGVDGLAFKVAMIFFALPSATSAYILASQMGGEPDLDAGVIVLSTLASFFSLSLVLWLIA